MSEKKTGGFLGFLQKVGVVEMVDAESAPQDDAKLPPVAPAGRPPGYAVPAPPPQALAPSRPPEEVRAQDEAAAERLSDAIEKVAGHYAEFTTNMETLADIISDEATRQQAAIKLITKKGVPVDKVLSDVDACLGALEEGNRDFLKVCEEQERAKIDGARKRLEECNASILQKQAQVAQLNREIGELMIKRDSESATVEGERANIQFVKDRFSRVYANMKSAMQGQRALIASFRTKEQ